MPHGPPLFILIAHTALMTAMAMPKSYVRGVEEERSSLTINGGLCYNTNDVFETTECETGKGDIRMRNCRRHGKCRLDNTGYVCCCGFCTRRSLNKSANFCGDDGVTYTSVCEYNRQQCVQNKHIKILYKGQCNDTCAKRRNDTEYKQATGMMPKGYKPDCQESNPNLYKLTQCNMTGGLKCWCVMPDTNQNITEPRSVFRKEELHCEQELKIAMLSKSCNPCKIAKEIFRAFPGAYNYGDYYANTRRTREPRSDVVITRTLFVMFDRTRDNFLSSGELDLIARWLYISRECLLDTLSICDDDNDGEINTTEWCTCLMNRFKCPELRTPRGVTC